MLMSASNEAVRHEKKEEFDALGTDRPPAIRGRTR